MPAAAGFPSGLDAKQAQCVGGRITIRPVKINAY